MEVNLINYQEDALAILLYTKNTRLQGSQSLEDIKAWPMEKQLEELGYMRDTIKSSWEFATYIFEIKGVTRAFTHQLVRTRTASYAQESMRSGDVSDHEWLTPRMDEESIDAEVLLSLFDSSIKNSMGAYSELIDAGMPIQDARGLIPTNIKTSIIMGCNLRTLHQMAETRLCVRTQGEYQDVFREMRKKVVEVHPWAEDFIQVFCANHGTCCFPRYDKCPIKKNTVTVSEHDRFRIKTLWERERHEAVVEAKDGRSM